MYYHDNSIYAYIMYIYIYCYMYIYILYHIILCVYIYIYIFVRNFQWYCVSLRSVDRFSSQKRGICQKEKSSHRRGGVFLAHGGDQKDEQFLISLAAGVPAWSIQPLNGYFE